MARFFNEGEHYFFEDTASEPPYVVAINQDTMFANMHRDEPLKDRVGILDDRDNQWWTWFRYDQDAETFDTMMSIAFEAGSILIRSTALVEVEAQFMKKYGYHEGEEEALLGSPDGN